MYRLAANEHIWVNEIWDKIELKMKETLKRNSGKIPYFTKDGRFDNKYAESPC